MVAIDKILSVGWNSKLLRNSSRKTRIILASALFLTLCAFGAAGVAPIAPDAADLPVSLVEQELGIPSLSEQIAALETASYTYVSEEKIRPGDTLATLLNRLGINDDAAASFIKTDRTARNVLQLTPGKRVQAQSESNGTLLWLSTTVADGRDNPIRNIMIARDGQTFKASESLADIEKRVEMRSVEIKSSLFAATDAAQIPETIAMQIVNMFATNIDFASDLRRGDRFNVVFETIWQGGEYIRPGRVLAAEFHNGDATYQSIWFDEPGTRHGGGYYSFDGKSLKKAFLKSPLEFSRISSGFSVRRHPISGQWKAHQGVDFAAPTGTPIRASGDGVIDFIGVQGGYGNVIVVKHWSNYSTAYAHMSRFASGMRKGAKVAQGDIIGHVGSTGWSTGPHLHYEFRVNNQPRDPLSVDVPNAQPLAGAELQRFRSLAYDMTHRFALLNPTEKYIKLAAR
jgi:murein DD-endopeptidase MepM/ murein hydrolase activator NlpD